MKFIFFFSFEKIALSDGRTRTSVPDDGFDARRVDARPTNRRTMVSADTHADARLSVVHVTTEIKKHIDEINESLETLRNACEACAEAAEAADEVRSALRAMLGMSTDAA